MNVHHHTWIAFRYLIVFRCLHWLHGSYKSRIIHSCTFERTYINDQNFHSIYLFVSLLHFFHIQLHFLVLLHTGIAKMRQERQVLALQETYSKVPSRKKKKKHKAIVKFLSPLCNLKVFSWIDAMLLSRWIVRILSSAWAIESKHQNLFSLNLPMCPTGICGWNNLYFCFISWRNGQTWVPRGLDTSQMFPWPTLFFHIPQERTRALDSMI